MTAEIITQSPLTAVKYGPGREGSRAISTTSAKNTNSPTKPRATNSRRRVSVLILFATAAA